MRQMTLCLIAILLICMNPITLLPADAGSHRDRITRSGTAKHAFKKASPCPSTGQSRGACPGYVIDHITPLACGGSDHPSNMQWQTIADGKAKDRIERKTCQR